MVATSARLSDSSIRMCGSFKNPVIPGAARHFMPRCARDDNWGGRKPDRRAKRAALTVRAVDSV